MFKSTSFDSPGGLSLEQVTVDFSPSFAREPTGDLVVERCADEVWDRRLAANPRIFNGSKFRLASAAFSPAATADSRASLHLQVGLTDYRSHLGVNCTDHGERLRADGAARHLCQKIGVGAVVTLSDSNLVFIQRSQSVAECAGLVDVPGGHPEPKECGLGHECHGGGQSDGPGALRCYGAVHADHHHRHHHHLHHHHQQQHQPAPTGQSTGGGGAGPTGGSITASSAGIDTGGSRLARQLSQQLAALRATNVRLRSALVAERRAADIARLNASVRAELFASITEEVRAEINIPVDRLGPPRLIGMVEQVE